MANKDIAAPQTSIAEDLSAAFDAAEEAPAAPAPAAASPSLDASPEGQPPQGQASEAAPGNKGPVRDATGRFAPKGARLEHEPAPAAPKSEAAPALAPEQPAAPEAAPAEAPPAPDFIGNLNVPPSTWSPLAKAEWAALPEAVRKDVKKREGDMIRGLEQYRQQARIGEEISAEMRPYEAIIRAEGGTPQTVVRSLLNTAYQLRSGTPQQRGALILQLAQQYGADLSPLFAPGAAAPQAPALAQMVDQMIQPRLAPLMETLNQYQTAEQQRQAAEQQQMLSHVEAFRTATDEQGHPRHAYFDNVRGIIASFLAEGHAQNLEQAYEMACNAHPEVSAARAAEQRTRDQAQQLEEAKRKAAEARRAGFNVTGQGGVGIADPSKLSLRDELATRLEGGAAAI